MDLEKIEGDFKSNSEKKFSESKKGMVASAFPDATKAGVSILRKGGNAVDAACATALALGVCEPQASGLGGQSMAILHIGGRSIAIDGSSRSPSLANSLKYQKKSKSLIGYRATTVPSTVAVLGFLHERYGRLEWPKIVRPAIRIAEKGYKITKLQHDLQVREMKNFKKVKSKSGAKYFLKDGLVPYEIGEKFIQEDLADTLRYIAAHGYRTFYHGQIAKKIDQDMRKNKGLIRAEDLAWIPEPIERTPISRAYRHVSVVTLPPPAAGRTLLLVLMMLNHLPSSFLRSSKPISYHFIAETFRKAFLHRVQRPFNPHTYHQIKDKLHLERGFAKQMADSIHNKMDATLPMEEPFFGGDDTTHLSVMDDEGNAVGITQSIELAYGSKAAADGLGFLYNNYMSAFEFTNPNHPYFIRPNAIPWTSVSPALVFHRGKLWMVVGSPGSQRIFSAISHFLSRVIDGNLPMNEAIDRPRFHCTIGGVVSIEDGGFEDELLDYLADIGYTITKKERYSFYHGAIHAVIKKQTSSGYQGVAEVRRDGTAEGVD
ncbi:MAG: gamma-glutamyltransferase family protein [Crenarchaeota archaeon]|nr:MAG: gamma-glutamyltransferase family protein [Thermoproteota archaeon]RDJ33841.1 MAG: gamma-glutamyltransferase family protein [Thermoproteota archaeon]RDJ37049.1 MAG: gamma-glutamyltransferase family protein [Thermoproteota archaeon]RDJ37416.1 MAG: gamma-glutamyltransferase family protein [Thermoproteota archaeon]